MRTLTNNLRSAGWCGAAAAPYPLGVVRAGEALALAACGGGGGAAQLLPAAALEPLISRAEAQAYSAPPGPAALRALLDELERGVRALTAGPRYRGAHAEAVATWAAPGQVYGAAVGHCRLYRVRGSSLLPLTRDETLYEELLQHGQPALDWHRDVLTRALGAGGARPWQIIAVPQEPGAAHLLCTGAVHGCLPPERLAAWTLEALAEPDLSVAVRHLWQRGHDWLAQEARPARTSVHEYQRRAALVLMREPYGL